jgi:hypothetical protein
MTTSPQRPTGVAAFIVVADCIVPTTLANRVVSPSPSAPTTTGVTASAVIVMDVENARHPHRNASAATGAAGRWDPVTASTIYRAGRISTGVPPGTVRLPIYNNSGAIITELPLSHASLVDVQLSMDSRCIGLVQISSGRFNECASAWATSDAAMMPYGTVRAVITASVARTVLFEAGIATTLCNFLAGSNCDTTPQAMWARQPDTTVGTEPGYNFIADFAAVSARIL